MLHMIAAGIFLCIGFWIGKKITNTVEYHSYIQGEKFKEKMWPVIKRNTLIVSRKVADGALVTGYTVGYGLCKSTSLGLKKLIALKHGA